MKYTKEFSEGFEPWSGAVSVYERIIKERSLDDLENALEQIFEGKNELPSDTEINDLLWFDSDTVYNILGMVPDDAKTRTLDDIREAWEKYDTLGRRATRAEIIDCEFVRVYCIDPEEEEATEDYEDLTAEEIAALFDDESADIDDDKEIIKTWKEG